MSWSASPSTPPSRLSSLDPRLSSSTPEVIVKLNAGNVVALFVVLACFGAGMSALRTGEISSVPQGQGPIIHLDGFGAYVMGCLLIGVAIFVVVKTFRR